VDPAAEHLGKGVSALATLGSLRLKNLALCSKVHDFGKIDEFPSYAFKPGDPVLLYVEVENFGVEQIDESDARDQGTGRPARRTERTAQGVPLYETHLQGRYEILDESQRPVASRTLPVDRYVCRNHRRDYFIAYLIHWPEQIPTGRYTLELTVEDKKADKFGNGMIEFQVK